jgi:biopolymer transport protein ExbD
MRVLSIGAILILITCLTCACKKFSDSDTVTRIKVAQDGTIFLNGSKASLEDVKKNLEQLKANKGRVRYFRENPQGEAPPQALGVIKAITDAGVPIKLCTSEDDLNGTQ